MDALQQPADLEDREDNAPDQSQPDVGLRVAQQLVGHAKAAGSSDNITVMLVFLRPLEQLLASPDSSKETPSSVASLASTSTDASQQ